MKKINWKYFLTIVITAIMSVSLIAVERNESTDSEKIGQNSIRSESTDLGNTVEEKVSTKYAARKATDDSVMRAEAYQGEPYVVINNNVPQFTKKEIKKKSFERYETLDKLGRCRTATACIGTDLMPSQKRKAIGMIKPTGWHTKKYDFVDGKYLYNRCHLIGYQLTGENANRKNLITGTRYFNVEGMLPFENMVADFVKETENHVMYRVTPRFRGNNLLADGVQIEGYSVEDQGESICFNVFCYNVQPGVVIDYATGESWRSTDEPYLHEIIVTQIVIDGKAYLYETDKKAIRFDMNLS